MTQELLRALACPATLEEAAGASETLLVAGRNLSRMAVLVRDSTRRADELRKFLTERLGKRLSQRRLWSLERSCRAAISEAAIQLTVRRGARVNPETMRRTAASRHSVNVWQYVLLYRLRAALRRSGVKPGTWGAEQAHKGAEEGLLFALTRLCGRLAGVPIPRNLDRIRREVAMIERPPMLGPVLRKRLTGVPDTINAEG